MTGFAVPPRQSGNLRHGALALDSAALIATSAVTALVGLVFWGLAARMLTPEVLGVDTALISLVTTAGMVAANGTGNSFTALLPAPGCDRRLMLRDGCRIVAVAAAVIGVLAAVTAVLSLHFDPVWTVVGVVAGTQIMAFFALKDAAMVGLGASRRLPVQNLLASAAKLSLLPLLCLVAPHPALLATLVSAGLAAAIVIAGPIRRRAERISDRRPASQAPPTSRDLMVFSLRDGLASSMTMGVLLSLPFITTAVAGPVEGAIVALALSVGQGLDLVAGGVGTALVARLSAVSVGVGRQALRPWLVTQLVVIVIAVLGYVTAPLIVSVFGSHYRDTPIATVIRVLLIASALRVGFVMWASVLRSQRQTGRLLVVSTAAIAITLPAIVIGAQQSGAFGAACGLAVGSAVIGTAGVVAVIRGSR